jgi:O-antigen ligase
MVGETFASPATASQASAPGSRATAAFVGVSALALVAPYEGRQPLVRLPAQSISTLEAALLVAFALWGMAILASRRFPDWRTPLTLPWIAFLAATSVAAVASPVSRLNAFHMVGRLTAAFAVFLLAVNGVATRARLRTVLALVVVSGVVVSVLAFLEYLQVGAVLTWLTRFRPGIATIGDQPRAGGPLQYPTIASMYLEVVFAFGLGVLLSELDASRRAAAAVMFALLLVIVEAIVLTYTRAGLVTIAVSLVFVGVVRQRQRGADTGVAVVVALAALTAGLVLASRSAQSLWLRFTSEGQESWYRMAIDAPADVALVTDAMSTIPVAVTNTGRVAWDSQGDPPFYFSYHWLARDGDQIVAFQGERTAFAAPVDPGATVSLTPRVRAPRQPGRYRLVWDIEQEGRLWFSTESGAIRAISQAEVTGPGDGSITTSPPPRLTVRPGRLLLWKAAARMFLAHPLLGVGPDNFRLSYGGYAGLPVTDTRIHTNNMYLEVLVGAGLIGVVAFLWLLRSIGRCTVAALQAADDPGATALLGVAAAIVAIGLHAVVDSFLSFGPTYVLFSLTLGLVVAGSRGR